MIQQEIGSVFIYEGTRYVIGEPIVGTKESEYEGFVTGKTRKQKMRHRIYIAVFRRRFYQKR